MDIAHHHPSHTSVGNVLKRLDIVTYWNQLEVAPLKNLFLIAVLKLNVKDSFGYNKEYIINLCINTAEHVFH